MKLPQLKRLQWSVRAVLLLGIAASVAANILHANPNPISQTISAWPPLALLLTVELCTRIPIVRRSLAVVRILATASIAGIAAWISYWHMVATAARYGESADSAHLLPLTVDGLIVVASVSLVELAAKIRSIAEQQAPLVQAQQVVDATARTLPVPVSPAPVREPATTVVRAEVARPTGRSGPQVKGPSKASPLTGRILMEETPQT